MKLAHLLLATVVLTTLATSQQPNTGNSSNPVRQRVMKMAVARVESRLNLTDLQRSEVKSVVKAEEPAILAMTMKAKQERDELAAMQSFNDAQVRDLAQKYATTNTDILVERTKVRLALRSILNDTQRTQLDQLRARVGQHFAGRLGEGFDSFIDAI